MVDTRKFSQFTAAGEIRVGDQIVGYNPVTPSENFYFNFPGTGILDVNGEYLFRYATVGASAVNYVQFTNNITGNPPQIDAEGSDTDINLALDGKGTGRVTLSDLAYPKTDGTAYQILGTDGAASIQFFNITAGTGISINTAGNNIQINSTTGSIPTPGAAGTFIRSDGAAWQTSAATIANTYTQYSIVYAATANNLSGLAPANNSVLLSGTAGEPVWSGALTNGQIIIGNTGAQPSVATITGINGIDVINGAGTIQISGGGGGYNWTEVTGTTQAMAVNSGYVASNAALVTLTLPATAALGDTIIVQGKGTGGWRIAQNGGQIIHFNSSTSTLGVLGYIESTQRYNSVELLCITANNEWAVVMANGNLTVF